MALSYSIRAWATIEGHADVAQLVERDLAKVEVAGSSPVVRSKKVPGWAVGTPTNWSARDSAMSDVTK